MLFDARDRNCLDLFTEGISTQTVPPVEQHTLKLKLLLLLSLFFGRLFSPQSDRLWSMLLVSAVLVEHARNGTFQQTSFYITFEQVSDFYITSQFPVIDSISCSWGSACRLSTQHTVFFSYNTFTKTLFSPVKVHQKVLVFTQACLS